MPSIHTVTQLLASSKRSQKECESGCDYQTAHNHTPIKRSQL